MTILVLCAFTLIPFLVHAQAIQETVPAHTATDGNDTKPSGTIDPGVIHVVDAMQRYFANLPTLEIKYRCVTHYGPEIPKLVGWDLNTNNELKYAAPCYEIDMEFASNKSRIKSTFDGKTYYNEDVTRGSLSITTDKGKLTPTTYDDPISLPFTFAWPKDSRFMISEFSNKLTWQQLAQAAKLQGKQTFNGHECAVLNTIRFAERPHPVEYTVYCALDMDYYPVGFRVHANVYPFDTIVSIDQFNTFKSNGKNYVLPVKISSHNIDANGKQLGGYELVQADTDSVKIGFEADASSFQLDVSQARSARDLDTPTTVAAKDGMVVNGGIGLHLCGADFLHIPDVVPDTPAWKAGIRKGDLLISVDSVPVNNLTADEIAEKIRGKPGTKVTLEVESAATHRRQKFDLTRAIIHLPATP